MRQTEATVESADGTEIAYERMGEGPPLIVIGGATCDRARMRPVCEALSSAFCVVNYDRRGRGASGDRLPYAVERECEDLAALVAEQGGTAALYGHSSGAALALHAVATGLTVSRLVAHDPPFTPDAEDARRDAREYAERLDAVLSEGRRDGALELFFRRTGMPVEAIAGMRQWPSWPGLEAIAPTLAYDAAVLGSVERGATVPVEELSRIRVDTLVLAGGASPPFMVDAARRVADAVPRGRFEVLEGQGHAVEPDSLVGPLSEFLRG